jgi:uncharacterized YigZ family protein
LRDVSPSDADFFWEPEGDAKAEIKIKRSLFIGQLFLCKDAADVRLFLAGVELEHKSANHNCWAYCLDYESLSLGATHFSDDGEPAGTAGRPILAAIKQSGIVNVMVVVTRYFGGIKLGVRGLIDAYGQTAADVISRTPHVQRVRSRRLTIRFSCEAAGDVTRLLNACGSVPLAWRYDADALGAETEVDADFRVSTMSHAEAALDELLAKKTHSLLVLASALTWPVLLIASRNQWR